MADVPVAVKSEFRAHSAFCGAGLEHILRIVKLFGAFDGELTSNMVTLLSQLTGS
jgi:hypothetical protein